jgi:hypothetical protein
MIGVIGRSPQVAEGASIRSAEPTDGGETYFSCFQGCPVHVSVIYIYVDWPIKRRRTRSARPVAGYLVLRQTPNKPQWIF